MTDGWPTHWTGKTQAICGMARVDGATFRWCGPEPRGVPAMEQVELAVALTTTRYRFRAAGARLDVSFQSPLLPDDVDLLSRPITYVRFESSSDDGKPHDVTIYFDASCEWCVNAPSQAVQWGRYRAGDLTVLRAGSKEQAVLAKSGDDLRIDWGWFHVAFPRAGDGEGADVMTGDRRARESFASTGALPGSDDLRMPRAAGDDWPVLAAVRRLGRDGGSWRVLLAYDDEFSIELFQRKLRPWWRRDGAEIADVLVAADRDRDAIARRCRTFDEELTRDLAGAFGARFARLAALAYRQSMAAHKIAADLDGAPRMFPKENFSNGCISTVDVIYPSAPLFLFLNPALLRAQLTPVLDYARMPRWKHPFAPHDLGTYPWANGQVYGGGEKTEVDQMPVEECGNMLLLVAALARADGDLDYARRYWPQLETWAAYLKEKGLDPENQLCTDDFAGHLAHNANLSLKAILAIGAFAQLADGVGQRDLGRSYRATARDMVERWRAMAADGGHTRLAFDKAGTWSQKYNLVWDRILGLDLFPPEVARAEVAFYKTKLQRFGLPLDGREPYTKVDWSIWSAALAESREDFDALANPLYDFVEATPDRVPLTDWYRTTDARKSGFQARSVVGGVFLPCLSRPALRDAWLQRARTSGAPR